MQTIEPTRLGSPEEISTPAGRTRVRPLVERTAPWAGLQGMIQVPGGTVSEGLKKLDSDWTSYTEPVYRLNMETMHYETIPNRRALLKPDSSGDKFIDIVSDNYEAIPQELLAQVLDPLSQVWPIEVMGFTYDGKRLVIVMKAGQVSLNGDDLYQYAFFSDRLGGSGGGSTTLFAGDLNLRCVNQYQYALERAKLSINIPHRAGAGSLFKLHTDIMCQMSGVQDQLIQHLQRFGRVLLSPDQLQNILTQTYPEPPKPEGLVQLDAARERGIQFQAEHGQALERYAASRESWETRLTHVHQHRALAEQCLDSYNQERLLYAQTGYAVWNAITEAENHRGGRGRSDSILFGNRAGTMRRAYTAILEEVR